MEAWGRVKTALAAWETGDVQRLASCLSDDFRCRNLLPQPVEKQEYLRFMQAMMQAFPDWSWSGNVQNEHTTREGKRRVHVATRISATHTGELVLFGLPVILPTGITMVLPLRRMHCTVNGNLIEEIDLEGKPDLLEEVLLALGMRLP